MCRPRRKSADVGGLALALREPTTGSGWGGWDADAAVDDDPQYAQILCDMYNQVAAALDAPSAPVPAADTLSPDHRHRLIGALRSPTFEPYELDDTNALLAAELLFELLLRADTLPQDYGFRMLDVRTFLCQLSAVYRAENHYHNFHHALDVLQATALFLADADLIPPVTALLSPKHIADATPSARRRRSRDPGMLRLLHPSDLLALFLAAIGHDAGHPGLSNAFMRNAQTPLSVVYNNQSTLEQMHCALLMHIMRRNNLGHLLTPDFKRMLHGIIIATDMTLHGQWMEAFAALSSAPASETGRDRARLLCCQALIKCADISNPARPHAVAWNWAAALHSEWADQAQLERHLGIQVSVTSPKDSQEEAKSQIGFISACALPLFKLCSKNMPSLATFTRQCELNLQTWQKRLQAATVNADNFIPARHINGLNGDVGPFIPAPDTSYALPISLPISLTTSNSSTTSYPGLSRSRSREPGVLLDPASPIAPSPSESTASTFDSETPPSDGYVTGGNDSVRAAYQAGKRKKTTFSHRGSWSPSVPLSNIEPANVSP